MKILNVFSFVRHSGSKSSLSKAHYLFTFLSVFPIVRSRRYNLILAFNFDEINSNKFISLRCKLQAQTFNVLDN